MSVAPSFEYLEKLRDFFYGMLELRDRLRERGGFSWPRPYELDGGVITGTVKVKVGFPSMLRNGGVIMDVTNVEQAQIAEEAGAWGGSWSWISCPTMCVRPVVWLGWRMSRSLRT